MMTRTVLLRALACVAAAACCVVGVSSPSDAADTPVPVPPSPVSQAPELPLLPGREIKMAASLAPSASNDMGVGERVSVSELRIRLRSKYPSPKITLDECTMLANTFWSGSAPNYHSTVDYDMGICVLTAHYANDARHAFYSLDEDGTITARAPMVYLHQIASSFETVHFTRFDYWFSAIVNTQCNADPSHTKLDATLSGNVHLTTCTWNTDKGATIPTTDDPLMTGTAEPNFYTVEDGTVGPFTDLTVPANPFTITPTQADEPASGTATEATASESSSASSRGLLIGVGAGAALLLLAAAVGITWARRRTS
nr:hypothetical protein [uncultured Actinomyces sp.]